MAGWSKERREYMTVGTIMVYAGMGGIAVGAIGVLVCLKLFPSQRKKLLKKLGDE